MSKPKPKFRVWQVVATTIKPLRFVRITHISDHSNPRDGVWYDVEGGDYIGAGECLAEEDLRPLTKRESGGAAG
jgi:hypothetical protein